MDRPVGVMKRAGSARPVPYADRSVLTIDPEEACQDATEAGLVVHCADPLNCETPLARLTGGTVMPNEHFYVRNHFDAPRLRPATWRLSVDGLVERRLWFGLPDLKRMPVHADVVTLECAGNGRTSFQPPVGGEPWRHGAVSTAEWTGVPLLEVLDRCGISPSAREVVFRGADAGTVAGQPGEVRFERSLTVEEARTSGALLAYTMNGEPLPTQHGHPLRLIVPGWYAMASVKWLTEIELIDGTFDGHFQTCAYVYDTGDYGEAARGPVRLQHVRSLITEPADSRELGTAELTVRGVAWSGAAPIAKVHVSANRGPWERARLIGDSVRHGSQPWELPIRMERPGPVTLRARATDQAGHVQPDQAKWNGLGYGNNAIQHLTVWVR